MLHIILYLTCYGTVGGRPHSTPKLHKETNGPLLPFCEVLTTLPLYMLVVLCLVLCPCSAPMADLTALKAELQTLGGLTARLEQDGVAVSVTV